MALDAVNTLRHAFGSLKTPTGQKLIGIFLLVQGLNLGGSLLMEGSGAMLGAGTALSLAGFLGTLIATIGGFRSIREGEIQTRFFTSNLLWPFGRLLGANVTSSILALGLFFILALPAVLVTALTGAAGSLAAGAVSIGSAAGSAGLLAGVFGLIGLLMGLGGFIYATVALIIAQPLIAIDNKRLFQALDESVQRSKGQRLSIFASLTGLFITYLVVFLLIVGIGQVVPDFVTTTGTALLFGTISVTNISLLNHLTENLPEA